VFVGVLQADIENRGGIATIQTFLELFFADAFDGHALFSPCPSESSSWRDVTPIGAAGRLRVGETAALVVW